MSRYERLRHYAFHPAKLAGAAVYPIAGDITDFLERRLRDMLLLGIKLAPLVAKHSPTSASLHTERRRRSVVSGASLGS